MPAVSTPLSDALALIPDAALALGPDGTVTAANAPARAMLAGDPVGAPVARHLPLTQVDGEPRTLRLEGRRANNVPFPVEVSLGPPDDRGVVCILREVKDAALVSEAQRYFDVAFDRAPIGMALFNSDGEYVRVNDALCAILGRTPDMLLGRRDQEITHPDDREADVAAAWEILDGVRSTHQCEKRFVRPDGSVVWTLASLTFLRDDDGRPLSWLGQFQDITARRAAEEAVKASDERHRLVVRNLAGTGVIVYDRDLRCVLIEGEHVEAAGIDVSEIIGRPMHEVAPEAVEELAPRARRAFAGETSEAELRSPMTGRLLHVRVSPHRADDGEIVGALMALRDVTAQREAERATRDAEHQFEVIFERAPIGMAIISLDGSFVRVNRALSDMNGYGSEEICAMEPFALVHPDDRAAVRHAFAAFARDAQNVAIEHRSVDALGEPLWLRTEATLIRDADGKPLHVLAQTRDITERRRHEAKLEHLANHDPLTGLLNRRGFQQALDQHVARVRRYGPEGALLVIDLDGFKRVNDSFGHAAGDELVVACARALRTRLRESDLVGRLGGDEFAVLLPAGGATEAHAVAQAVVEVLREASAESLPAGYGVTASVGVALADGGADDLLAHADQAMYEAKAAGRDRYVAYGVTR